MASHMSTFGYIPDSPTLRRSILNYSTNEHLSAINIRKLLDSSHLKDKLDAMKNVIELLAKGRDMQELFADVIKNVATKSVELKKLVYIYLLKYAESQKEIALLSVNTFQKELNDHNELIRGLALRVLCSLNIPEIMPVILISIRKGVNDKSPYVRRIAAQGLCKAYEFDPSLKQDCVDLVRALLGDNSTLVVGAAVVAYLTIVPDNFELIHPYYRKYCKMILDVDEWSQMVMLRMLVHYIRAQISKQDDNGPLDRDIKLLETSVSLLLHSRSSSVVLDAAAFYYYILPKNEWTKVVKPFIRLCRTRKEVAFVVLQVILALVKEEPSLFQNHVAVFFMKERDPEFIRKLKFQILAHIVKEDNLDMILAEFEVYVQNPDSRFVSQTISTLGSCARNEKVRQTIIRAFIRFLDCKEEIIYSQVIVVLCQLVSKCDAVSTEIIQRIALETHRVENILGKSHTYWVTGFYCDKIPSIAPDILRLAAKKFERESFLVKLQILSFAARMAVKFNDQRIHTIFCFMLKLSGKDPNHHVRDKARILWMLFVGNRISLDGFLKSDSLSVELKTSSHENIEKILFSNQVIVPLASSKGTDFMLNSLSFILDRQLPKYKDVPEWTLDPSDSHARDFDEAQAQYNPWLSPLVARKPVAAASLSNVNQNSEVLEPVVFRSSAYEEEQEHEELEEFLGEETESGSDEFETESDETEHETLL